MGYLLSDLKSLRKLDLSDNSVHDTIPYQLPPNLTSINLAGNNLSGNLPYSISSMVSLSYLNVSHNSLFQSIGDICANLAGLTTLDLFFNNFSGDLPSSLSSLVNVSSLYLQNNQLSGSLNVLTGLPLTTLNVTNNRFRGWLLQELKVIPKVLYGGNSFDNGPAPPPPPYTPPPPGRSNTNHTHAGLDAPTTQGLNDESSHSNKGLTVGAIAGINLGSIVVDLVLLLLLAFCIRKNKRKEAGARTPRGSPQLKQVM